MPQILTAVVALAMLLAQPAAPLIQSVDLAVPVAPVGFRQSGRMHLAYELHITNFLQTEVSLAAVTVRDGDGQVLAQYNDTWLQRRMTRPGLPNSHPTPHLVAPGLRAIVNLWVALPPGTAFVKSMSHTVELDVIRPAETIRTRAIGGAVTPAYWPVPELDAPLRGGPWIAIYDPMLKGGHRTAIYTLDGRARIPGRFAIDFISFPQSGALPAARAADSNGFGAEVLAVADGTITIAVDGVPDAAPPPIPLEQASGNHIAIDVGEGRFAFYEHLQLGSVGVKAGDRVTRGQVIARDTNMAVPGALIRSEGSRDATGVTDADGNPLTTNYGEYLLPLATEMPRVEIIHHETPSPHTVFGQKGSGESGYLGAPAAVARFPRIATVLAQVQARPGAEWSLPQLARAAGMSRTNFAVAFHEIMGEAPMHYVTRLRMLEAKLLLENAGTTVAESNAAVARQADVVILDTVDADPMKPGVLLSERGSRSSAQNLINVAISRARGKLVIVADVRYFQQRAPESVVSRMIARALDVGCRETLA